MGNCAGFTANRVFSPCSVSFLSCGTLFESVSLGRRGEKFGLPVGPFALDLIGVDVSVHVASVRDAAFAPRHFTPPRVAAIQNQMIRDRDSGRVTGRGWYSTSTETLGRLASLSPIKSSAHHFRLCRMR